MTMLAAGWLPRDRDQLCYRIMCASLLPLLIVILHLHNETGYYLLLLSVQMCVDMPLISECVLVDWLIDWSIDCYVMLLQRCCTYLVWVTVCLRTSMLVCWMLVMRWCKSTTLKCPVCPWTMSLTWLPCRQNLYSSWDPQMWTDFDILSFLHSHRNSTITCSKACHLALNILPHFFGKLECSTVQIAAKFFSWTFKLCEVMQQRIWGEECKSERIIEIGTFCQTTHKHVLLWANVCNYVSTVFWVVVSVAFNATFLITFLHCCFTPLYAFNIVFVLFSWLLSEIIFCDLIFS